MCILELNITIDLPSSCVYPKFTNAARNARMGTCQSHAFFSHVTWVKIKPLINFFFNYPIINRANDVPVHTYLNSMLRVVVITCDLDLNVIKSYIAVEERKKE